MKKLFNISLILAFFVFGASEMQAQQIQRNCCTKTSDVPIGDYGYVSSTKCSSGEQTQSDQAEKLQNCRRAATALGNLIAVLSENLKEGE